MVIHSRASRSALAISTFDMAADSSERSSAARALTVAGATCGIRAADVPGRGENGNT